MRLPIYQIDAFADSVFTGNPAAVVPLDAWLDDRVMQAIAAENNVSETAFFVAEGDEWRLRWFTPTFEIDLCGHATLASAWLISERLQPGRTSMRFHTKSGALDVSRSGDLLALDFPSRPPQSCAAPANLHAALGRAPSQTMAARDYFCVYDDEADIRALAPDMIALAGLDRMMIVTAPGRDCDFVSRFFAPRAGIPEDPVTGSAHCTLTPYWAKRLGKSRMAARQLSQRGGSLTCEDRGARVGISGRCVPYLEGTISV